jgi:hypothetical protein
MTAGILRPPGMQLLIFNFKTKAVGVVGSAATRHAYADIVAAQQKIVASSPTTAAQPQISR